MTTDLAAMTISDPAPEAARPGPGRRLWSIIGGSSGNLVEWYDWYVYSAFSLYFAKAFFPKGDATAQLLNAAGVFAVGFLMRPVGGWLMGVYADRYGRRRALAASVLLMCFGSLLIAVVPGYAEIGLASPIILVLARMIQGVSLGGEYGTSATYLSEMATGKHRGFYSSFQYVTLIGGQLIALLVLTVLQNLLLTPAELEAWGWRIPFAIGALLALYALYLRRRLAETEAFETRARVGGSLLSALARHPKAILTVIGLTLGGTVAFYTFSTYMQKFLVNTVGLSKESATIVNAVTLFGYMLLQPVVGALSDRVGRRPILIAFGVLGSLGVVPLMTALARTHDPVGAGLLIMAALVIVSGYTAINAVVKAELFPAEVRALGVGFPYAIAVSLFGGTAEYIALWFKDAGAESDFFWYVAGCIFVSLLVYVFMPDTRRHSKIETD